MIKRAAEKLKIKDVLLIILGTLLMGAAINFVFDPVGLDVGGVSGLAIVIKYASVQVLKATDIAFLKDGLPVWLTSLILNIPLFAISFAKKGMRYIAKTVFATLSLTFWTYILPIISMTDDMILNCIVGGVLSGVGIGMVLSTMATTGGTDMFSAIVHEKFRHISIPVILAITDGIIVILGFTVFKIENIIYAIIVVFLVSKISDTILEGLKFAKMAFIISEKTNAISTEIMDNMDRGVTGIRVKGMYSGTDKQMLFCVVSKKQIPLLKDIVYRHDKTAFMVIADAREVMGEGFAEVAGK